MAANIGAFNNSQHVNAETITITTSIRSGLGVDPLEKLRAQIAVDAIHDSMERSSAPKCQPNTRVAAQNDLYNWVVDEESTANQPKKIKWVTGPAGTGKSAVMGSLSERCKAGGVLAATFFFSSGSSRRHRKTAFVTTIAHQLARYHTGLREGISKVIEANSDIFDKNLDTQMKTLILRPLQEVAQPPVLRGAIIIDGLDECEAEHCHNITTPGAQSFESSQDQLEILQALRAASSDPSFPFRILIASRPERVFREFFDLERNPFVAQKVDLNEQYNADADITLFLEVQFDLIRSRFRQLPSGTIQTLVENASGQFIYAATVIRLLKEHHQETPGARLDALLKIRKTASNPLKQLDALYTHVLKSSPDPPLSVRWIVSIGLLSDFNPPPSASIMNMLLQTEPDLNEAEHLLGNLHSLIGVPPSGNQETTKYSFYHKSMRDFLEAPDRCGELYVGRREIGTFIWDAFVRACTRASDTQPQVSYPENFLSYLAILPADIIHAGITHPEAPPSLAGADWWVSEAIRRNRGGSIWLIFLRVHSSCPWYRCTPACRMWTRSILHHLKLPTWTTPNVLWSRRQWFQTREAHEVDSLFRGLVRQAIRDAQ